MLLLVAFTWRRKSCTIDTVFELEWRKTRISLIIKSGYEERPLRPLSSSHLFVLDWKLCREFSTFLLLFSASLSSHFHPMMIIFKRSNMYIAQLRAPEREREEKRTTANYNNNLQNNSSSDRRAEERMLGRVKWWWNILGVRKHYYR